MPPPTGRLTAVRFGYPAESSGAGPGSGRLSVNCAMVLRFRLRAIAPAKPSMAWRSQASLAHPLERLAPRLTIRQDSRMAPPKAARRVMYMDVHHERMIRYFENRT